MADPNRRSLHKVTFSSIHPSNHDIEMGLPEKRLRGLDKIAYVSALRTTPNEVALTLGDAADDPDAQTGLAVIAEFVAGGPKSRKGWSTVAKTSPQALAAAGRALARQRRNARAVLSNLARSLIADHLAYVRLEAERAASVTRVPVVSGPPIARLGAGAPDHGGSNGPVAPVALVSPASSHRHALAELNPWEPKPTSDPRLTVATLKSNLAAAIDWARVSDPKRADTISAAALQLLGIDGAKFPGLSMADWDRLCGTIVVTGEDSDDWTDDLVDGFEERMKVEPIGRVHLERLDMTPVGVVRGELLHSVGLAPKESVTLIHREWSSRETSFEKVVTDEFEQSTEDGVTENTELASATEVQSRHSRELSTEVTGSASYMFASGSIAVGYNSTSEDETAKQESRNHSVSVTRKASSRTRKEHKTTFTVKETAGVEDQVIRTLTNPSEVDPMRIDFHQLMRKWKVDLYRYGVRLTFDLVVPAPGIDLLENLDELRRIDHVLAQPFTFDLLPSAITRANWADLAAKYTAQVEPPPAETVLLRQQHTFGALKIEEAGEKFETLEFDVPDGYRVWRGEFRAIAMTHEILGNLPLGAFDVLDDVPGPVMPPRGERWLEYRSALEHIRGRSGHVVAVMRHVLIQNGYAQATLEAVPTADMWRSWQHAAWTAMRRGAEEQWNGRRQELRQRRDQLGAAIASWDPLSLRKMEREEIMKTTLKWIFGPAFDLMPSEVARLYTQDDGGVAKIEPSRLTPAQWAQVMGLGEFIKYLQQAIEWENVLFFVYPYFWDNPRNHKLKRFLNHPDSLHRAFLRGGAARVVLTVRPGFEESFTRLFETGTLDDDLGTDHPYVTIAQEIRNYAATHYPGIPGDDADPDDVEAAERGVRIGQWSEYTPISATDITVNTPLEELT